MEGSIGTTVCAKLHYQRKDIHYLLSSLKQLDNPPGARDWVMREVRGNAAQRRDFARLSLLARPPSVVLLSLVIRGLDVGIGAISRSSVPFPLSTLLYFYRSSPETTGILKVAALERDTVSNSDRAIKVSRFLAASKLAAVTWMAENRPGISVVTYFVTRIPGGVSAKQRDQEASAKTRGSSTARVTRVARGKCARDIEQRAIE